MNQISFIMQSLDFQIQLYLAIEAYYFNYYVSILYFVILFNFYLFLNLVAHIIKYYCKDYLYIIDLVIDSILNQFTN